jgi:flagellar motor switch protein FliG
MGFSAGQKLPGSAADLDGIVKSAILLLSLDEASASSLLRCMPQDIVLEITETLTSLEEVPHDLVVEVVEEFYDLQIAHSHIREGGHEYACSLLRESLDPARAARVIGQIEQQVQRTPFDFLQRVEGEALLSFIQDEHPQTIALIVSYLDHARASEILTGLPESKQIEVVRRVANMEHMSPDIVQEVEAGLEDRLSEMMASSHERVGGVQAVAEVLNLCDRSTEKKIMDGMLAGDPGLAEDIRRLMFVFEDVRFVDDTGIQSVLQEIDNSDLAIALKTGSAELKDKVFSNMSVDAAKTIRQEMEDMGPVRLDDVESAQQRIVDVVRRLEDASELIITGRGGVSEVVV